MHAILPWFYFHVKAALRTSIGTENMADPLGIIGLIGVATQIVQIGVNFGLDWKDAPADVKSFRSELQTLKSTLSEVHTNIILNQDFLRCIPWTAFHNTLTV